MHQVGFTVEIYYDARSYKRQTKDKLANQPAKKLATPYRIHVLPLLNRRGWKKLILSLSLSLSLYIYIYIYIYIYTHTYTQDIMSSVIEGMM